MTIPATTSAKRLFFLLLLLWLVINIVQAIFTEINSDEAYYFIYGKNLSLGYFDHPPMVALLTHLSSFFFNGNLGVRFMTTLLQIGTLVLIWLQIDGIDIPRKKVILFFTISASVVMFSVYGFITTPDVPLLFFTALFLYSYQKFIERNSWLFTFLLIIAMAGLVYSKYQGILVAGLVILSNLRLLRNPKFLIAIFSSILLFVPHLWWQYTNNFPSFRYQIVDRSAPFEWKYFFEYILNQFLVFNPLTLGAVLYVLFKYKPIGYMERAQYFLIIGFLLVFWGTTFRGHAEPHWTIAAAVPMIVLLNNKISVDTKLLSYVSKFVSASLILVLFARIIITTDVLPPKLGFHGKASFFRSIEKIAGNAPVVFTASYREPSLYTFFTGKPATVISSLETRKTQFDLWKIEQNFMNKPAFVSVNFFPKSKKHEVDNFEVDGFFTDSFQTANCIQIDYQLRSDIFKSLDPVIVDFTLRNPTPNDINFLDTTFAPCIYAVFLEKQHLFKVRTDLCESIQVLKANTELKGQLSFVVPDLPLGHYRFGLSCYSVLGLSFNADFKKIRYVGK